MEADDFQAKAGMVLFLYGWILLLVCSENSTMQADEFVDSYLLLLCIFLLSCFTFGGSCRVGLEVCIIFRNGNAKAELGL